MKKLLLVLLAMLLCVSAVACSPQESEEPTPDTFLGQEWYLTQKPMGTPTIPELTAEQENAYIQLPKEYSQTIDGVTLQLEFFKESYRLDEIIQLRIIIRNDSEREVRFDQESHSCDAFPGAFVRQDGALLGVSGYGFNAIGGDGWNTDASRMTSLAPGESVTFETIYEVWPDFFCKVGETGRNYLFQGKLARFGMTEFAGQRYEHIYTTMVYTIPVEVFVLPGE